MASGFVLCADDFALTEGVSRSILDLAGARQALGHRRHDEPAALASASRRRARSLRRHGRSRPASQPDLRRAARRDAAARAGRRVAPAGRSRPGGRDLGRPRAAEIAAEIARQLDAFEDALGRAPDFIDGHQHVHVLPGIRRAVLRCRSRAAMREGASICAIPADSVRAIRARGVAVGKALVIAGLALGFRAQPPCGAGSGSIAASPASRPSIPRAISPPTCAAS